MIPKGKLLIIGGAEDTGDASYPNIKEKNKEFQRFEILTELLKASKNKKIEIITSGSRVQEEVKRKYQKAFHKIGYPDPGFMQIKDKDEAREESYITRAKKAGAIFFTGGDQFRLSTILGGTELTNVIRHRYLEDEKFLIAGTSAGAMVMSSVMIAEGGLEEALIYRDLNIQSGFSFLRNCIIDTHFIKRGRFGRLAHAIIMNPDQLGIGLGEDTALIIKHGTEAECRGSGMVIIIDGSNIQQTNIIDAREGEPVFVENLKIHILVKGCRFSIKTRELYNPAIKYTKKR